ncbi:MAG: metalloendopeptidase, partial [Planctomycetia bacterium]
YQRSAALLATHGIAALLFDPIGQGERRQFLTPKGTSACGGCVGEHNATGSLLVPLGRNLASWMIWDAMRGLDYLASRPDIRADRLGCMGNSGGGTQTAYVMALDERVAAAAVSCYLTSLSGRLPRTIGPQDAEQNVFGQLAFGMDHADYLFMRTPRPTLVCAATRDFFDIGDTRQAVAEARRIYDLFGAGERLALAETDAEHGFSQPLREAACRFMLRWLAARDEPVAEPADLPVLAPGDLTCTPTGSVFALPAARTFAELAADASRTLSAARLARGPLPAGALRERSRMQSGMRPPSGAARPRRVTVVEERAEGAGRRARLEIETDVGIVLPADLWTPASLGRRRDVILVDGKGRTAAEEAIGALVAEGRRVLAVDLCGMGQTAPAPQRYFDVARHGVDGQDSFLAYLLGRSLVGMRADDLAACAGWLAAGGTSGAGDAADRRPVELVAVGLAVIPALHAAAVHPELFAATRLDDPPRSWSSHVERGPLAADPLPLSCLVHGALVDYDLPDLIELVGAEVRRESGGVP